MFPLDRAFIFTSFIIILNQYIDSKNLFKVLKKNGESNSIINQKVELV